jgi:uncharacterized protein (TIGR00369 family)
MSDSGAAATTTATTERIRTVTWDDPVIPATAAMTMQGIDFLRGIASGEVPSPPVALLLGIDIVRVDAGSAVFVIDPGEHLYNPIGSVHGGTLATLADSALGCAVHSMLPAGVGYTTVDLNVTYLRPATRDSGPLTCEAEVVHSGRKIATARAQIVDNNGRLYATATTTCLILRPERAGTEQGPSKRQQ